MNTKNQPIKMRNRFNLTDVYYTLAHWPSKEIDGVLFLPVVKNYPSNQKQPLHYIRKDSLEKTK
jgi:hypothetical protein